MGQVIKIDEARIKGHLGEIVRGTVEYALNAMLDAEVDQLYWAGRRAAELRMIGCFFNPPFKPRSSIINLYRFVPDQHYIAQSVLTFKMRPLCCFRISDLRTRVVWVTNAK